MSRVVNFSDAASIGIHSMILIAKAEKPLNAIHLSDQINFSKHHIAKVLQRLVKDGYLLSFRGPTGGFLLKKEPGDILLYDIYRSIEGEIDYNECPQNQHTCPFNKCIRNSIINKLSKEFEDYMKSYTLKDYL
jgi:Rrf2 family protein